MNDPMDRKEWRDAYRVGAHNVIDAVREQLQQARESQQEWSARGMYELAAASAEAVRRLERVLVKIGVNP